MKLVVLLVAVLVGTSSCHIGPTRLQYPLPPPPAHGGGGHNSSHWNVLDFGAVGDGKTDNTVAFQNCFNAASADKGGIVEIPDGQFLFKSAVSVPSYVYVQGTYKVVPSHAENQKNQVPPTTGSVLMPTGNRGTDVGYWWTLSDDSALQGVVIYYPDQKQDEAPAPYPWTIRLAGPNAAVTDIECLNCWNAIYAVQAHRHYIARIQGQPLNTGVYIDETYDIGRVEDVHFNPWYSSNHVFMRNQLVNGRAFVIARTDWEYMFNCFAFAYAIGYHFIESPKGSCNGNFLGIGADLQVNASIKVDAADPWGILVTNGEFTSFAGTWINSTADHTQIVVTAANRGAIRVDNSAFWGPSNHIARIAGTGSAAFTNCIFNTWDADKKNDYAIEATGFTGELTVNGNNFQHDGNQVDLGASKTIVRAVVTSNMMAGAERINGAAQNQAIGMNAAGGAGRPALRKPKGEKYEKLRAQVIYAVGQIYSE